MRRNGANKFSHVRLIAFIFMMMTAISESTAQQARGLFFGVFGQDAPASRGDNNHSQLIYIDIPEFETRPVYLRIFDAEVGGYLDERHGTFDSETRFIVLGGNSAARIHGGQTDFQKSPYIYNDFSDDDIILDRTFGVDARFDGRYYNMGALPLEKGFRTLDGYRRFVFASLGIKGDDGNFFDFVLSHDPDDKVEPNDYRMFAYDLTMRTPAQRSFVGQIRIPVEGREKIYLSTFGINNAPISVLIPFQEERPILSSGSDDWVTNEILIPNPELIESIGLNFNGIATENTFSFVASDENGVPIAIPIPIVDYVPVQQPVVQVRTSYAPADCNVAILESYILHGDEFLNPESTWMFENDTLRGRSITIKFDEKGYHPYTLSVTGSLQGLRQTAVIIDSVHINTPPTAWAGGNRSFVAGESMAFDGTVSEDPDGRIVQYFWDFGDGNTATGARVDHIFRTPGTYTVTLRVRDNSDSPCNEATASVNVRVNLPPVARILAPNSAQYGDTILLDGSQSHDPDGEIVDYLWEIEPDTYLDGPIVEYVVPSDNPIQVKLTVTDDSYTFNSTASATKTIRVNRRPIANAGADKHVSPNRPATFNASQSRDPDGQIVRYEWIFPDSIIVEGVTVQQGIAEPGDHYVFLNVYDNDGAVGTDSLYVRVNFPPVPVISGNLVTNDGRVELSASESHDPDGKIITYEWNLGDGRRSNEKTLTHVYRRPGTYTVQLAIRDDSGTYSSYQTTSVNVHVNQIPIAYIDAPEAGIPNRSISFDGRRSSDPDGSITKYKWNMGDGTLLEGPVIEHTYNKPGIYQVQLQVFDDTLLEDSFGLVSKEISIKSAPVLVADFPKRVAPNDSFVLDLSKSYSENSEIQSYFWLIDGDWISAQPTRTFIADNNEQIEIRYAVANSANLPNSRTEGTSTITVNRSPIIPGIPDVNISRNTVFIDASASTDPDGDALVFNWYFGDDVIGTGSVLAYTFSQAGNHEIRLEVNDQMGLRNSTVTKTIPVRINRAPIAVVNVPATVCLGSSFTFDASESTDSDNDQLQFRWDFGTNSVRTGSTGSFTYTDEGLKTIVLTLDDGRNLPNSVTRSYHTINVVGSPIAKAGNDITTCTSQTIVLDGSDSYVYQGNISSWEWDLGDGNRATGAIISHRYVNPGTYNVKLTVKCDRNSECNNEATDNLIVTVLEPIRANFEVPNHIIEGHPFHLTPSQNTNTSQNISSVTWEIGNHEIIEWVIRSRNNNRIIWSGRSNLRGDLTQDLPHGELPSAESSLSDGQYAVKLTVGSDGQIGCNQYSITKLMEVKPVPLAKIDAVTTIGVADRITLALASSNLTSTQISSLEWRINGVKTGVGPSTTYFAENSGVFDIELFLTGTGVAELLLDKSTLKVNAQPVAIMQIPTLVVSGEEFILDAGGSFDRDGEIIEYIWEVGSTTHRGSQVPVIIEESGEYRVVLTVIDNSNVTNSIAQTSGVIRVNRQDVSVNEIPSLVCQFESLNLNELLPLEGTSLNSLQITVNDSSISGSTITFSTLGINTVHIQNRSGNMVLQAEVEVVGSPQISAVVPGTVYIGDLASGDIFDASASMNENQPGTRYYWNMGDGTTHLGPVIRHKYARAGVYQVKLTAISPNAPNCASSERSFTVNAVRD